MDKVRVIRTAKNTSDRLTEKEPLMIKHEGTGANTLIINENKTYQKIIGFGGAFTEAASYVLSKMDKDKQKEIIKKYFDINDGLGYCLGRVHINSCDFALENYTYVEENDVELKTFDIKREKRWVIPFIKAAEAARKDTISLLASPWSPPGFMKSNSEMNNGGKLLNEYMDAWAKYYVKFIKAMRAEKINVQAITVQNEPAAVQVWDSCIYTYGEERDFVKNYLGPALEKAGLQDIKIYIWDHNRDIILERAEGVLKDPKAYKYVYGIANHWYCSEEFENLSKVHEMFPEKHMLFSEGCQEGGVHLGSWDTGERYGRNIIGDFNNWQEGFIDWNLILDEKGGPNHVGNFCDAPVIADTKMQKLHYNSSYYYIGQFSRYVKPGAVRIEVTAQGTSKLQKIAFKNEDDSIVLIVMNETDEEENIDIKLKEKYINYTFKEHSIATFIFNN